MSPQRLEVALALPEISAHSGGVERCLQLMRHSALVNVAYTVLLGKGGIPDPRVAERIDQLARDGVVALQRGSLDAASRARGFDALVAPSEFWTGPLSQARTAGARGPGLVEFMQLPYVGTLDVLKTKDIDDPALLDLIRLPFISARVLGDNLALSAFQLPACALSVRSLSRLGPGRVLGLTAVVTKNLKSLGFPFEPFIPECPVGVDADAIRRAHRDPDRPEYDAVYVGRFHPHKGFLDLPRVVAELRRRARREIRVAVCGSPQFPRHLHAFHRLVKEFGVERNLSLLGWQTRDELYRTIASSRVLLYPSYVDSFSITVLESLCLGTPVAGYAIDALKLIWGTREGVTLARVGDPRDLAERAMDALTQSASGGLEGRLRVQAAYLLDRYTWARAAASERQFYDESLQGSRV